MIHIENLSKKYGESVIFENTSFSFPDRGLVCILGPSGCGKSTLLNLIAGFDSEYAGDIFVQGSSLSGMEAQERCAYRRSHVGFVFQNYHLLSGYTALENVLLASDAVGEDHLISIPKAKVLLHKLGLSDKEAQKIRNLSGGQKQRVAIARALVNDPSVILADEPTGALDRRNSSEIMELLKELAENRLVIVITHDKKCAEYAERVVSISEGKLVEEKAVSDEKNSVSGGKTAVLKKETGKIHILPRAVKNFRVHLPRHLAVAAAIAVGALCFTLSLSTGNGMEQSISDFQEKNTALCNGYIKAEGNEAELLALLRQDRRLENIYAQYVMRDVSVKIGEQTVEMAEKYPMAKAVEEMSYGVMPRCGENEIAVSPSMAAKFDENIQNLIGKTAEVSAQGEVLKMTVSGIFNASYDDFFISSDVEQRLYRNVAGRAYSVSYDVIAFEDIVPVYNSLREQGIRSESAYAKAEAFLHTFQNLRKLFLTVSILIFAVSIIISAILLVKQQNTRFREVGLLAALGYTGKAIHLILIEESLLLCAAAGICSGVFMCIAKGCAKLLEIPISLSLSQILLSLFLTVVTVFIISVLTSLRLIRTEPAEALRK